MRRRSTAALQRKAASGITGGLIQELASTTSATHEYAPGTLAAMREMVRSQFS